MGYEEFDKLRRHFSSRQTDTLEDELKHLSEREDLTDEQKLQIRAIKTVLDERSRKA